MSSNQFDTSVYTCNPIQFCSREHVCFSNISSFVHVYLLYVFGPLNHILKICKIRSILRSLSLLAIHSINTVQLNFTRTWGTCTTLRVIRFPSWSCMLCNTDHNQHLEGKLSLHVTHSSHWLFGGNSLLSFTNSKV